MRISKTPHFLIFVVLQCSSPVLFADITAEEYSLLSTVLTHGFGESCEEVAIEEKTSAGSVALTTTNRPLTAVSEILGLNETLLEKWQKINQEFEFLAEHFELPCDYLILSTEKLASVFATAGEDSPQTSWQNFRKSFPNLAGVMRLSKPAIDQQMNEALAYVEFDCGAGCGSGRFISLSKDSDSRWQVSGGSLVWMATE